MNCLKKLLFGFGMVSEAAIKIIGRAKMGVDNIKRLYIKELLSLIKALPVSLFLVIREVF